MSKSILLLERAGVDLSNGLSNFLWRVPVCHGKVVTRKSHTYCHKIARHTWGLIIGNGICFKKRGSPRKLYFLLLTSAIITMHLSFRAISVLITAKISLELSRLVGYQSNTLILLGRRWGLVTFQIRF